MVLGGENCGSFATSLVLADLNEDGCDDLLIGDPYAMPGRQVGAGQITVLHGRENPPANWVVDFNVTDPDLTLYHDVEYANLGLAMALGDYDGDGHTDLVCSTLSYMNKNKVYIVRGPLSDPPGTVRDFTVDPPDRVLLASVEGSGLGMNFILADVTADGKDDLIAVTVPLLWTKDDRQLLAVVFGEEITGSMVRDLTIDPPEVVVRSGSGLNVPGNVSMLDAADLTGDGAPDLIFSDYWMLVQEHSKGAVLVIDNQRLVQGETINLTDDPADMAIIGKGQGSYFGRSLDALATPQGPVLAVSATSAGYGKTNWCGVVYQLGPDQLGDDTIVLDNIAPETLYYGTRESYSLGSSLALVDLDGNGEGEVIVGAYGPNLLLGNGVVHIFYDRYDLSEPVDDDTVDDDIVDDDTVDDDADDDVDVDDDDDAVDDDDDDDDNDSDDGCGC